MANKKYEEADVQAIAVAIREKTGSENTYNVSEMASGVDEVYEAGKKQEWSDFWDSYQRKGTKTDYKDAFNGSCWSIDIFKPKYDIQVLTSGQRTFQDSKMVIDLRELLKELDVSLTIGANVTRIDDMFAYSGFTALPEINAVSNKYPTIMLNGTFSNTPNLTTIEKLLLNDIGNTTFSSTFSSATSLKNITIEGVIGKTISFSSSPLTVESMKSVITHLKNYSGTTSEFTYNLTLSSASKTALEAEGATSPNGNLWSEYVDDLGWTLL